MDIENKRDKMRKVVYSEYEKTKETGKNHWNLETKGIAFFHGFGFDFEGFENGPGNFSTAIIELEDGTVKNLPVENIKFVEEE